MQNEYSYNSDNPQNERNRLFNHTEFVPRVDFGKGFSADGVFVFEPQDQEQTLNEGNDIWFDRHGAFIEQIRLNYENGPYNVWAGKFNPDFGKAWDWGRGIWSEDFAEDYEITEKWGAGAGYHFETARGDTYNINGTSFFADTTALGESVITKRDRLRLEDGGASNTKNPSSFTLSFEGQNPVGNASFGYHAGYRFLAEQGKNQSVDTDDESGFVLGLTSTIPVAEQVVLDVLLEYTDLSNFEGVKNADRQYSSASVIIKIMDNWNATVGYTQREIDDPVNAIDATDDLFQLSGGYDFQNGTTLEVGYRYSEESGFENNMVGFLLRYQLSHNPS